MPKTRTGHFVHIWRPRFEGSRYDMPKYVEVGGRGLATTIDPELFERTGGWVAVSRELPLRRARRFAKMYARTGFKTRVVFRGNGGEREVVLELDAHRKRGV
jgi:hypothetical protein